MVSEIAAAGSSRGAIGAIALACAASAIAFGAGMPWFVALLPAAAALGTAVALRQGHAASAAADREAIAHDQAELVARLGAAAELARIGTWHWDLRRGRVHYDRMCAKMLGYSDAEIDSTLAAWGKLVHPDDLGAARAAIDALVDGKADHYEARVRLRAANGTWRTILDRGRVISRDREGRASQAVGVHIDVTAAGVATPPTPSARGRWVIVDDDDSVREVTESAARRLGLDTVSFADPQRAWEAIGAGPPLGIITDFEMPGMTGVQLAERVRAAGLGCPLLLVSGSASPALSECRAIDGLLDKPFSIAKLEAWLDRHAAVPRASGTEQGVRKDALRPSAPG